MDSDSETRCGLSGLWNESVDWLTFLLRFRWQQQPQWLSLRQRAWANRAFAICPGAKATQIAGIGTGDANRVGCFGRIPVRKIPDRGFLPSAPEDRLADESLLEFGRT